MDVKGTETNKFVKGAFILTLAGFISKALSAGYRIPLQNLTGDIGFYVYQQVYPILGIAMMLALYGFPSAISRMVTDLKANGKSISWNCFLLPVFLIIVGINSIIFALLFLSAPYIANWVGDPHLVQSYRYTALIFLFVPFISLLRGIFQGKMYMTPIALSQVTEQIVRVVIIIVLSMLIFAEQVSIYMISEGAAIVSIAGSILAFVILVYFLLKNNFLSQEKYMIPWKKYFKMIALLGIAAALNHMTLLVIQLADTLTLVPNLIEMGMSEVQAMENKGVIDRGQPLIQFGMVLASSFALAIIPAISRDKVANDPVTYYPYIETAFRLALYIGTGATIGLITLFPEVNQLLFEDQKGTMDLQILVFSIFLISMIITGSSILQGIGKFKCTARFVLVTFVVKLLLNEVLVPMFGITGSAVASLLSLALLFIFIRITLKKELPKLKLLSLQHVLALSKASLAMLFLLIIVDLLFIQHGVWTRIELLFIVLFLVFSGAIVFLVILIRSGAFTDRELKVLPFADILLRLQRR